MSKPTAYLLQPEHAVELHAYLIERPMSEVRKHVERLESLTPLFAQEEKPDGETDDAEPGGGNEGS